MPLLSSSPPAAAVSFIVGPPLPAGVDAKRSALSGRHRERRRRAGGAERGRPLARPPGQGSTAVAYFVAAFFSTTTLTGIFAPGASRAPGRAPCFTTLPSFLRGAFTLVTLPSPQPAPRRVAFAAPSFLPTTFGTVQPA